MARTGDPDRSFARAGLPEPRFPAPGLYSFARLIARANAKMRTVAAALDIACSAVQMRQHIQ
jgi:hypothetical protein